MSTNTITQCIKKWRTKQLFSVFQHARVREHVMIVLGRLKANKACCFSFKCVTLKLPLIVPECQKAKGIFSSHTAVTGDKCHLDTIEFSGIFLNI